MQSGTHEKHTWIRTKDLKTSTVADAQETAPDIPVVLSWFDRRGA